MFIHIGEGKIISGKKCVGIFNAETIRQSEVNIQLASLISDGDKTVAVDECNNVFSSKVSPFTVIKRNSLRNDIIWRRKDE